MFSIFYNRKHFPKIAHPTNISEYWIQLILSGEIEKISYLADKYAVRSYVESKGLGDFLPNLLGAWKNANDIDFEGLPQRFALKMNFGAGMNIICTDKTNLNINDSVYCLNKWLNSPTYNFAETHYNCIERRIICEEFIGNSGDNHLPTDYKFMCINGEPFCILACSGRESNDASYVIRDLNWNIRPEYMKELPCLKNVNTGRPNRLNEMIEIARILSKDIPLVRIDLYETNGRIYFGEITLTPAGGIFHRWSQKALDDMGEIYRNS